MPPQTADEARAAESATGCTQSERFALELEFVMALANPRYLRHLATEGTLDDPAFLNYLDYLRYWTRPEYAKFILYPHALYFLDQLRRPEFRKALRNPRAAEYLYTRQYEHWQVGRDVIMREVAAVRAAAEAQAAGAVEPTAMDT